MVKVRNCIAPYYAINDQLTLSMIGGGQLINPNKSKNDQKFDIILHVPEELNNDASQTDKLKVVNGKIENLYS